eukprot:356861-Chlamydomonas_euryale.AAC.19
MNVSYPTLPSHCLGNTLGKVHSPRDWRAARALEYCSSRVGCHMMQATANGSHGLTMLCERTHPGTPSGRHSHHRQPPGFLKKTPSNMHQASKPMRAHATYVHSQHGFGP